VEYADFCRFVRKGAVVTLAISGVTGLILIIFAKDVATILPLNIFESELPIHTRFRMPACQMKVILPILPKFGYHGNVLNQKRGPDRSFTNKCLSFGEKIAKIGPAANPEIICL